MLMGAHKGHENQMLDKKIVLWNWKVHFMLVKLFILTCANPYMDLIFISEAVLRKNFGKTYHQIHNRMIGHVSFPVIERLAVDAAIK